MMSDMKPTRRLRHFVAATTLSCALILASGASASATSPTSAPPGVGTSHSQPAKITIKRYANCAALNKVYKGGVAAAGVKYNTVAGTKRPFRVKPLTSTALYKKNTHLDRDKDGVACEKG